MDENKTRGLKTVKSKQPAVGERWKGSGNGSSTEKRRMGKMEVSRIIREPLSTLPMVLFNLSKKNYIVIFYQCCPVKL